MFCDLSIPSCPQNKQKNTVFKKYKNPSSTKYKLIELFLLIINSFVSHC